MRAFQRHHGLPDSGRCDEATWISLVEASWRLGERSLRLIAPYLRGDDVARAKPILYEARKKRAGLSRRNPRE